MVYLIHFDKPYKHARHYIGYTENLDKRMHEHELGTKGARLLQLLGKQFPKYFIQMIRKEEKKTI